MSRPMKKYRQPQGRGNPWMDMSRGTQQLMANNVGNSDLEGVYSNPHMAHALTTLIGCTVAVKTTDGVVYEGVLNAVSPNMDIALSAAHDKSKVLSRENVKKMLELRFNNVISVSKLESSTPLAIDIFRTDTEISKSNGGSSNRELERFTDFADTGDSLDMENSAGWSAEEMFSVNRDKFQVTSKFDENLSQYTTELNRDSEGYLRRAARARQLAGEIEGKSSGCDDVGTEEELFSAVVRGEQAPPPSSTYSPSSHRHTPTQPVTSTHTPDTVSTNVISNEPSDTVTSDQSSPSSSSTDVLLPSVSTSNGTDSLTTKSDSSLSTKDVDNIVTDTNDLRVSEAAGSAEPATVEESEVNIEGASDEAVPPVTRESPTTSKDTPTTTPTTEVTAVGEVTSSEDPPADPDSTTHKKPDSSKSTFKLNPNAKEFRFNPNAAEFKPPTTSLSTVVTVTSTTPFSPSQVSTTSTPLTSHHHHTGRYNNSNNRYKRARASTPSQNLYPTSEYILQPVPQSGGFVIPQGGVVGGMVRPGQIVTPPGNQVLFPSPYQLPSGQPGVINTFSPHVQQVVPGAAINAQQQIMLAPVQQQQQLYQQQVLSQQPGLLAAGGQPGVGQGGVLPGGGAVLPGASQGQPYQQVIYAPQGGQVIYTPPGGVAAGGGATPLVVSAGTVPLHSTVQQQSLISAVNPTQPPVFSPSRVNYPLHPPGK